MSKADCRPRVLRLRFVDAGKANIAPSAPPSSSTVPSDGSRRMGTISRASPALLVYMQSNATTVVAVGQRGGFFRLFVVKLKHNMIFVSFHDLCHMSYDRVLFSCSISVIVLVVCQSLTHS